MSRTWKLREGKVLVVEDASTASLVIVARDLTDKDDRITRVETGPLLEDVRIIESPNDTLGILR